MGRPTQWIHSQIYQRLCKPERVATPSNDETVLFFTKASPLSNHYKCNFVVNGKKYNCVEQYLMASKALHFKDTDIAAQIMRTENPGHQKGLGRKVVDFDLRHNIDLVLRKD